MHSFAAHVTPICGCATSMRRTLNAQTITFSTQKSSRVENTLQPKNRTPTSGTRFAATSTRALGARGATTQLVDLAALPAEPLLGRGTSAAVAGAIEVATRAGIIVAGTPVYRATYRGLLKVFFDLLPQDGLIGKIGVPLVTGHG